MSEGAGMFGLGVLGGVGRLGWIAGACAVLTAGFVVYRSVPLYEAGRIQGASGTGGEPGATTVAVFTESVKRDAGQINGRSLFYIPAPPPPKPVYRPPPPPEDPKPTGPPPPPPPPRTYGGPKIIGAAIDTVWFENGKRLTAGGEADGDLRVIEITQVPWSARLEWKGIEFDVPFIPRDGVVIKELGGSESGGSGSAPTVPPAAEEPAKEPAAAPGAAPPATTPPGTSPSADPGSPVSTPPAPSPAEPSVPPPTEKP